MTDANGNEVSSSDVIDESGVQIKITSDSIVADGSYYILHQTSTDEWEVIVPDEIGDGYLIATFTSLSPIVIVEGEAPAELIYDNVIEVEIDAVNIVTTLADNLFDTIPNYDRVYTKYNTTSSKYYTAIGTIEEDALDSIIFNGTEYTSSDTKFVYMGQSATCTTPVYLINSNTLYLHTVVLAKAFESANTSIQICAGTTLFKVTSSTSIYNDTELTVTGATTKGSRTSTKLSVSYVDGVVTAESSNGYQAVGISATDGSNSIVNSYYIATDSDGNDWIGYGDDESAFYLYPEYTVKDYTEESNMTIIISDIYVFGRGHISNVTFNVSLIVSLEDTVYAGDSAIINNYLKQGDYANTIILDDDVEVTSINGILISSGYTKTLDLNGHSITGLSNKTSSTCDGIKCTSSTLNIVDSVGTGSVYGGEGSAFNVSVHAYGQKAVVNIYGGNYDVGDDKDSAGNSTIYAESGTINIYDGIYKNSSSKPQFVLNIKNDTGISFINCYGGTYYTQNPADGDDADTTYGATFVADGYTVETSTGDDGSTIYKVVKDTTSDESVDETDAL